MAPPQKAIERLNAGTAPPEKAIERLNAGTAPPQKAIERLNDGMAPPQKAIERLNAGMAPPEKAIERLNAGMAPPEKAIERLNAGVKTPQNRRYPSIRSPKVMSPTGGCLWIPSGFFDVVGVPSSGKVFTRMLPLRGRIRLSRRGTCLGRLHFRILDKPTIIRQIIAALERELEGYARSARAAHAEATDEQSKAENKYDTRGLEASYLAQGQSRQAAELIEAIEQYRTLPLRGVAAGEPIALGAAIEVERAGERVTYFLGPRGGGTEVSHGERTIMIITPHSPIGRQLIGGRMGDSVTPPGGGKGGAARIVKVF